MTDLTIVPKWNATINRLERNEFATGGADGNMNIAPRQLAESIFWLKDELDKKVDPSQVVAPAWGNITGDIAAQTDLSDMYFKAVDFNEWAVAVSGTLDAARLEGDFYDITTPEPPNTHIDADGTMKRSTAATATLGTAATKDVGTAAGNVMEVGVNGLAGFSVQLEAGDTLKDVTNGFFRLGSNYPIGQDDGYGSYGVVVRGGAVGTALLMPYANYQNEFIFRTFDYTGIASYKDYKVWTDKNTPTSNLPVASIQAGIGAPKIAYKKLTGGTFSAYGTTVSIAHGLNASKILNICVVSSTTANKYIRDGANGGEDSFESYWDTGSIHSSLNYNGSPLSYRPYTVFITYEVD